MAIVLNTQYPGKTAGTSANYPQGEARNITVPSDGTGTPWDFALINDFLGFQQWLLFKAGVVPSGSPDDALASDYGDAMLLLAAGVYAAAGTDTYTVANFPATFKDGQVFRVAFANNNTGASTLQGKPLRLFGDKAAVVDWVRAGKVYDVKYISTGDFFELEFIPFTVLARKTVITVVPSNMDTILVDGFVLDGDDPYGMFQAPPNVSLDIPSELDGALVLVTTQIRWEPSTIVGVYRVRALLNGLNPRGGGDQLIREGAGTSAATLALHTNAASSPIRMAAGDSVEIEAFHTAGVNRNVSGADDTFFSVTVLEVK